MPSCYITQSPLGARELGIVKIIYIYMSLELLLVVVYTLLFLSSGARSLKYSSTRKKIRLAIFVKWL